MDSWEPKYFVEADRHTIGKLYGDGSFVRGMVEWVSAQKVVISYCLLNSGQGVLRRCCKPGVSWHFLSGILKQYDFLQLPLRFLFLNLTSYGLAHLADRTLPNSVLQCSFKIKLFLLFQFADEMFNLYSGNAVVEVVAVKAFNSPLMRKTRSILQSSEVVYISVYNLLKLIQTVSLLHLSITLFKD